MDEIAQLTQGHTCDGSVRGDETADQVEMPVGELDQLGDTPLFEEQHQLMGCCVDRVDEEIDAEHLCLVAQTGIFDPSDAAGRADASGCVCREHVDRIG